jgi:hypothetical protein
MHGPERVENAEATGSVKAPGRTDDQVMNGPRLRVLGVWLVRPIERIAVAARIIGTSRATAYRLCVSENWEVAGPPTSKFVLMVPFLRRYQIPFTAEIDDPNAAAAAEGDLS